MSQQYLFLLTTLKHYFLVVHLTRFSIMATPCLVNSHELQSCRGYENQYPFQKEVSYLLRPALIFAPIHLYYDKHKLSSSLN